MSITLVVPIYNGVPYIQGLLETIDHQTYRDFEAVFICDASPDQSETILQRELQNVSFAYKVIVRPEKGGVGSARDYALDNGLVKGDYVLFIDMDDSFEPTYLEVLINKAKSEDADMVLCAFQRVDYRSGKVLSVEMADYPDVIEAKEPSLALAMMNPSCWNKLMRVSSLHDCRYGTNNGEDACFLAQAIPYWNKIAFVKEPLYQYNVHSDSASGSLREDRFVTFRERMLLSKQYYLDHPKTHEAFYPLLEAIATLRVGLGSNLRACLGEKASETARICKQTRLYLDKEFPTWRKNELLRWSSFKKLGHRGFRFWLCIQLKKIHWLPLVVLALRIQTKAFKRPITW